MYNENQKMKFINSFTGDTASKKIISMFNKLSKYESSVGYDICNERIDLYAEIVYKYNSTQKYTYFRRLVILLFRYRSFCEQAGLIDNKIFFSNNAKSKIDYSEADIHSDYMRLTNNAVGNLLFHPDNLFKYVNDRCANERQSKNNLNEECIGLNDMIILYVMFHYFGICDNEIYKLKLSDILFIDEKNFSKCIISSDGRKVSMIGEVCKIISKRLKARDITFIKKRRYVTSELSKEYIFLLDEDDTPEKIKKRITNYRKLYLRMNNNSDYEETNLIKLNNIDDAGIAFMIANDLIKDDLALPDDDQILQLCDVYSNSKTVTYGKKVEFVDRVKSNYEYLKNLKSQTK